MVHFMDELGIGSVVEIALTNNITVYDASYIELARKLKLPITSNDTDILETAPKYHIQVFNLDQFLNTIQTNI